MVLVAGALAGVSVGADDCCVGRVWPVVVLREWPVTVWRLGGVCLGPVLVACSMSGGRSRVGFIACGRLMAVLASVRWPSTTGFRFGEERPVSGGKIESCGRRCSWA
jgi:hypothetical protein